MKSNKFKRILVKSLDWKLEFQIENFYDDPHIEACTRALEIKLAESGSLEISPAMISTCMDTNMTLTINTYRVLQNGSFWMAADVLRNSVLKDYKIDLKEEPISNSK